MKRPAVLTVTRRVIRKDKLVDFTGEYHLELLMRLGLLPVMIPVTDSTVDCLPEYAKDMAGLLIVEGPDIDPRHYSARHTNSKYLEEIHKTKDAVEIHLMRRALKRRLPVLGICRGSEMLNIVSGGTLYGDVYEEKAGAVPHIDYDHYDAYRHGLRILPGTPLEKWYGRRTLRVNSYHHQGIRTLAPRFVPMAYAEDGLLEAYYDPKTDFTVGLQFHPERMFKDYPGNFRVWQAFAEAVHRSARLRKRSRRPSSI